MERSIRRLRSHKSPNTGGMLQGRKTAGIDLKEVSMKNHKAARLNVCTHMIRGMQDFTSIVQKKKDIMEQSQNKADCQRKLGLRSI